jgi:hypothetical protein
VSQAFRLHVRTRGGISDLGRVVNVLALYALTPHRMWVEAAAPGMRIDMRVRGELRACQLCASRLSASPAVSAVRLSPEVWR